METAQRSELDDQHATQQQAVEGSGEQDGLHVKKEEERSELEFSDRTPTKQKPRLGRSSAHPHRSPHKQTISRNRGLVLFLMILLGVVSTVLFPALFSAQPALMERRPPDLSGTSLVGQVAFTSSGQLDPTGSQGLNDLVRVTMQHFSLPIAGQSDDAWLLPDLTDTQTRPLWLGTLVLADGTAHLTYMDPNHKNLLTSYSGVAVVHVSSHQRPTMPSLDLKAIRYSGRLPNTPTPGDEQQFSFLSHLRHLLASDPDLQQMGLQGGLTLWLVRNSEKILEWSSAARDSWAGGKQTDLIHRQVIRILEYLDGITAAATAGDLPPASPVLVDQRAGSIGLLEQKQAQALPGYLEHVHIHLQGLIHAPGHTAEQALVAKRIDEALMRDTSLLQRVHQDALKLVRMNPLQLESHEALSLLDDLVTNANAAYTGQLDPGTGGIINGIVWLQDELQGLAIIPMTAVSASTP